MTCGVNGDPWARYFRPTYVTTRWATGMLTEVRVWGPQVLKNGGLGTRKLDHVWKARAADGGVDPTALPAPVAARFVDYTAD